MTPSIHKVDIQDYSEDSNYEFESRNDGIQP